MDIISNDTPMGDGEGSQNMGTAKVVVISTREVAELTGKQHFHVVRDVENQFKELGIDASRFGGIYKDSMNRSQTEYLLDREQLEILLTGYSISLRAKVIKRLHELEKQHSPQLPDFSNPVLAARAWADEVEAKQIAIEQRNSALETVEQKNKTIIYQADKLTEAECELANIEKDPNSYTRRDTFKNFFTNFIKEDEKMKERVLNELWYQCGVLCLDGKPTALSNGLHAELKKSDEKHGGKFRYNTYILPAGREKMSRFLIKKGWKKERQFNGEEDAA